MVAGGGHASGSAVVVTTATFTVVAGLLTIARIYTRMKITHNTGVDDYLVAFAMFLAVFLTICMVKQVQYGMGRHFATLTPHDMVQSLKWFWASTWSYSLGLGVVKMSILYQYLRFFTSKKWRIACQAVMVLNVLLTIFGVLVSIFMCSPVNAFWAPSGTGKCLDRMAIWYTMAAGTILTDICTTALPIAPLNALRFPKRQKIILMVVFGLAGVTCAISILRLPSLYVISKSTDVSWDNPTAAIWSSMELYAGIICSCIPTLKGLVSRILPSLSFGDSYYHTRTGRLGSLGPDPHGTGASASFNRTLRESLHGTEKVSPTVVEDDVELHDRPPPTYKQAKIPATIVHPVRNDQAADDDCF
ncbi:hypothetical protein Slin14017_G087610 [Septoria linicola]|nr:hypothetical protein Slin14017_G087610 [Septoria linicola]